MRTAIIRIVVASAVMFAAIGGCSGGGKRESAGVRSARPLVIYLHGMLNATTAHEASHERVRERFRDAGFDVWTPKGRLGLCDWSEDAKQSVCWPSDERTLGTAREIVHEWGEQLSTRRPVVVVGFSNGGAFAVLLAVHGLVQGCGFVSMHGFPAGALHVDAGPHAPILLIGGTGAAWESAQMTTTTKQLDALAWPHTAKMHDGGHAVSDRDIDEVLTFARRAVQMDCPGGANASAARSNP